MTILHLPKNAFNIFFLRSFLCISPEVYTTRLCCTVTCNRPGHDIKGLAS